MPRNSRFGNGSTNISLQIAVLHAEFANAPDVSTSQPSPSVNQSVPTAASVERDQHQPAATEPECLEKSAIKLQDPLQKLLYRLAASTSDFPRTALLDILHGSLSDVWPGYLHISVAGIDVPEDSMQQGTADSLAILQIQAAVSRTVHTLAQGPNSLFSIDASGAYILKQPITFTASRLLVATGEHRLKRGRGNFNVLDVVLDTEISSSLKAFVNELHSELEKEGLNLRKSWSPKGSHITVNKYNDPEVEVGNRIYKYHHRREDIIKWLNPLLAGHPIKFTSHLIQMVHPGSNSVGWELSPDVVVEAAKADLAGSPHSLHNVCLGRRAQPVCWIASAHIKHLDASLKGNLLSMVKGKELSVAATPCVMAAAANGAIGSGSSSSSSSSGGSSLHLSSNSASSSDSHISLTASESTGSSSLAWSGNNKADNSSGSSSDNSSIARVPATLLTPAGSQQTAEAQLGATPAAPSNTGGSRFIPSAMLRQKAAATAAAAVNGAPAPATPGTAPSGVGNWHVKHAPAAADGDRRIRHQIGHSSSSGGSAAAPPAGRRFNTSLKQGQAPAYEDCSLGCHSGARAGRGVEDTKHREDAPPTPPTPPRNGGGYLPPHRRQQGGGSRW